jgi:hypothetical protein
MGSSWSATTTVAAGPQTILAALTDPDVIRRWSPVAFELEDGDSPLRPGSRTAVRGQVAGIKTRFDVQVFAADERGIKLRADGPVPLDVEYRIEPANGENASVRAEVVVNPGSGISGRLLARAVSGVLGAGALDSALSRMAAVAASAA